MTQNSTNILSRGLPPEEARCLRQPLSTVLNYVVLDNKAVEVESLSPIATTVTLFDPDHRCQSLCRRCWLRCRPGWHILGQIALRAICGMRQVTTLQASKSQFCQRVMTIYLRVIGVWPSGHKFQERVVDISRLRQLRRPKQ